MHRSLKSALKRHHGAHIDAYQDFLTKINWKVDHFWLSTDPNKKHRPLSRDAIIEKIVDAEYVLESQNPNCYALEVRESGFGEPLQMHFKAQENGALVLKPIHDRIKAFVQQSFAEINGAQFVDIRFSISEATSAGYTMTLWVLFTSDDLDDWRAEDHDLT